MLKKIKKIFIVICSIILFTCFPLTLLIWGLYMVYKGIKSNKPLIGACGIFSIYLIVYCNFLSFSNYFQLDFPISLFIHNEKSISDDILIKPAENGYLSGKCGIVKYDSTTLSDKELNDFYINIVKKHTMSLSDDELLWITLIDENKNLAISFEACGPWLDIGTPSKDTGRIEEKNIFQVGLIRENKKIIYYNYEDVKDKTFDGKKFIEIDN